MNIIPVNDSQTWKQFVEFPYTFYKNQPLWVAPLRMDQKVLLNPEKHPFYNHAQIQLFLAISHQKISGRVAAIIDHHHNKIHREKTGFFGFFESINDKEIAFDLLTEASEWLNAQGMHTIRGPVNPCLNEECGLLIDGFDKPPVIMMPYNPPYYQELLESIGFNKKMDLFAYYIDNSVGPPKKLLRVAEAIDNKAKVIIRPINMKSFVKDADIIYHLYNSAWKKNWGFVKMSKLEFDFMAKNLKQAIMPDLALLAEINGEPVGFSLSLPDVNQALIKIRGRLFPFGLPKLLYHYRRIDMIRIMILGVLEQYHSQGIDALFYLTTWRNAIKHGFLKGEMSWVLENNTMMNRAAKMLGGTRYKTYRLYEKSIL